MKDLLEYIAKALVQRSEEVRIAEVEGDRATIYEIHVAPEDVGKVIGRQGKVARAIRTMARAMARDGRSVHVEIID